MKTESSHCSPATTSSFVWHRCAGGPSRHIGVEALCRCARAHPTSRVRMRCARDRIWYQQPLTMLPITDADVVSLDNLATQFDVVSASYQIVEANRAFWRFSWKMSVRNYGLDTVVVSPELEFQNRDGFIVDTGISSMRSIRAQETAEITGTTLIDADAGPSVANALGRVKLVPLTSATTSLTRR